MADAVDRKCIECGAATKAFSLTLGKVGDAGRKTQKTVALGGKLCEACEAKRDQAEMRLLAAAKLDQYRQYAQIPGRYQGIDYAGFTAKEAVDAAKAWARGELRGLCLTGDVGIGKSWLAAAAIADMIARRAGEDAAVDLDEAHDEAPRRFRPVRWVSVSNLMSNIRRSFDDDGRAEATKVIAGNGAVVLDDIDKVNPTDFGREIVFSTLDSRMASGASVLVTTNLAPGQLGKRLGKAIASRIAGECLVVEMVGPDRRVRPAQGLRAA